MDFDDVEKFSYCTELFVFQVLPGSKSKFDEKLQSVWQKYMEQGCFRYKLDNIETRILSGKYGFVAQLNTKRAAERRKPQLVDDVIMPFNPETFHFGKVSKSEVIFQLCPEHWQPKNIQVKDLMNMHILMINVSPLEYCSSLLIPNIGKGCSQVLDLDGLRIAVEVMLMSNEQCLRIGFNSLGAYASVNHLHFHLYYLNQQLPVENIGVNHLIGDCYETVDYPSKGFVFQVCNNVEESIRSVMRLVIFLLEKKIAHNIFMTRGSSFRQNFNYTKEFNIIRIYVWPRKSFFGAKNELAFNPGFCELAGHLIIKDLVNFESIAENEVCLILKELCHDSFTTIRDDVKKLYE